MELSHSAAARSRVSGRVIMVAVAFALTTVFALISAQPAFADYSKPYTYTIYPGNIVGLDKCDMDATGTLNIPPTLGGYPVTFIDHGAFYNCAEVTTVTIPAGVTEVAVNAFVNCTNLTSIIFPDTVTALGDYLFAGSGVRAVWFRGIAPTIVSDPFAETPAGFTIYVMPGNTSWGTVPGTWNGHTTALWPVCTITPNAGAHGHVTASGPATGLAGFDTTFTIAPDAGYHIVDVKLDGVSQGAIATCLLKNVQGSHTIAATFGANVVSTTTRLYGGSRVKRYRTLRLSGTVSPRGPGRVTITMRRKVGHTWRSAGSVRATVVNGAYRVSITPKYRGSWRLVATYSGGVTGPTTYRSSKSVTKSVRVY